MGHQNESSELSKQLVTLVLVSLILPFSLFTTQSIGSQTRKFYSPPQKLVAGFTWNSRAIKWFVPLTLEILVTVKSENCTSWEKFNRIYFYRPLQEGCFTSSSRLTPPQTEANFFNIQFILQHPLHDWSSIPLLPPLLLHPHLHLNLLTELHIDNSGASISK